MLETEEQIAEAINDTEAKLITVIKSKGYIQTTAKRKRVCKNGLTTYKLLSYFRHYYDMHCGTEYEDLKLEVSYDYDLSMPVAKWEITEVSKIESTLHFINATKPVALLKLDI